MTQPPDGQLEVGRIGKPHGVRGDLFVSLTSDVAQRRAVGSQFTIVEPAGPRTLTIATVRAQQDRWVMHFEGIDDRNAAEKLVNKYLYAEPIDSDEALWVHDLIGSVVVDLSGDSWGECTGVVYNPAHEILELSNGLLIPTPFVVSCENRVITINPPEGLREALLASQDSDE
jgi:16S rRNA processing protein RimM